MTRRHGSEANRNAGANGAPSRTVKTRERDPAQAQAHGEAQAHGPTEAHAYADERGSADERGLAGSEADSGIEGYSGVEDGVDGDGYEDGNALAGPLAEIFAVDLTSALGECASCGSTEPVARLRVYTRAPGLVARCAHCGHVVLRLVRSPESAWLDMRGTVALRIPLGP